MKHKIKNPNYTEIEIADGFYRVGNEVYSIQGDNVVSVFVSGNYANITTAVSEYDHLENASLITKDEFDAELEKAFEIIRGKL